MGVGRPEKGDVSHASADGEQANFKKFNK